MEYMDIVFVYMYIMLWLQVIQVPVMTKNCVHAPRVLFPYYSSTTSVCIIVKLYVLYKLY